MAVRSAARMAGLWAAQKAAMMAGKLVDCLVEMSAVQKAVCWAEY